MRGEAVMTPTVHAQKAVARAVSWDGAARQPYGPMPLSPAVRAGLVGLRLLLGLVTAMSLFTFLHGLHG
jgi:hypothetical protein